MKQLILLILTFLPLRTMAQPEINVLGNGQTIFDGDITPNTSDYTYFDTAYCTSSGPTIISRSYVIENTGTSDLIISSIQIQGSAMYWAFQVTNILFPDTILAGTSDTFSIDLNMGIQDIYNCTVSIVNNDTDESIYNFDITGVVSSNVSATIAYTPYYFGGSTTTATGLGGAAPYSYWWSNGEVGNSTTVISSWFPSLDTINYTLWIVDTIGCGIAMDVFIPCAVISYLFCSGEDTINSCLPILPSFPMSYNVVNSGQNGAFLMTNDSCFQYTPSPTFSGSDTVTVEVCDSSSGICTFYTIIFNSDTSTLTTNILSKPISDISIYPNPNTQGQLTVDWTTAIQPKYILIIDALGREVGAYNVEKNTVSQQIDVQNLANGYYSVLLLADSQVVGREKLIIIKQ